jgi:nitroreductase
MEIFEALFTRRSIRKYNYAEIPKDKINEILKAAMFAPSAMNYQPWQFILVDDRDILKKINTATPAHADMLLEASIAVIVCGDLNLDKNIDYIVQNCSAATQNIMLAAHGMGYGSVWVGAYPVKETIEGLRKIFNLPESIIPVSIVAIGYPDEKPEPGDRFKPERIHRNKW